MVVKSKAGVYYDITQSDYRVTLLGITFVFSSEYNLQRFIESYVSEVIRFNDSASRIYKDKFNLTFDGLALVRFYTQIEKRDFYLIVNGDEIRCPDDLLFQVSVGAVSLENRLNG